MLTMICTIKFDDGKQLVGKLTADSPQGTYQVYYQGETERWPTRPNKTGPSTLKAYFSNFAKLTKSNVSFHTEGEYEIWAH